MMLNLESLCTNMLHVWEIVKLHGIPFSIISYEGPNVDHLNVRIHSRLQAQEGEHQTLKHILFYTLLKRYYDHHILVIQIIM